jgi:hypothetical protein
MTVARPGSAHASRTAALEWAPPKLHAPKTIRLGRGFTHSRLNPAKDYFVRFPKRKKLGATVIEGGRNVVIYGGYVTVPASAKTDDERQALYIKDNAGTVHVEGLRIDASGGGVSDGIAINSPSSIVQIENTRIERLKGSYDGWHSDLIQPWGGVRELRVDRLTGSTFYQGLFLKPDLGPIGAIRLSRVNLRLVDDARSQLLWFADGCGAAPTSLRSVYATSDAKRPLSRLVWPGPSSQSCPSLSRRRSISWRDTNISGVVHAGDPPGGDFVPRGVAGTEYRRGTYAR